jgi:predicted ester cyclase
MAGTDTHRSVLRAAVDAFNAPDDRQRYLDLYAPEVVLHGYPRGVEGWEGARSFYTQLWAAFPDARLSVEDVIESDDELVARYSLSGVQARDFYGTPVTGAETNIAGITWMRFDGPRVVEVWQASGTFDMITRLAARAAQAPRPRPSASVEAAALRWEETHPGG